MNAKGDDITSTNNTSGLNVIPTTPIEAKTVASSLVNSRAYALMQSPQNYDMKVKSYK